MTLGEKLSEKRRAKGMTQDEVAEKMGVTAQAVSKWENDLSCPDITLLVPLAELYGTSVDVLLGRVEESAAVLVPEEQRKPFDKLLLRIRVDSDDNHVKVNLPMPLVKFMLEAGMTMNTLNEIKVGSVDLSQVDFNALVRMAEMGMLGRLVEIEADDNTTVLVEVV